MTDSPEDLEERVSELEETLDALRAELEPERGPLGLPPLPTPGRVLRFTDEYAIPTAIAVLEANLRILELLQALLRAARGAPPDGEARRRATTLGRTTVDRIDRAIADLGTVIEDSDVPRDGEARSLLEEAKSLNEDVRDALADAGRSEPTGERSPDADGRDDATGPDDVGNPDDGERGDPDGTRDAGDGIEIDVDAELASIRDEVRDEGEDDDEVHEGTDDEDDDRDD